MSSNFTEINYIRKSSTIPFTQTPNLLLYGNSVSLKAMGLFTFMLGKPDGWKFTIRSMSKQVKDGITSISSGLNELKKDGWVKYIKKPDGTGEYLLSVTQEFLEEETEETSSESALNKGLEPNTENPNQGYTDMHNPNTENPNQGFPKKGKSARISNKDSLTIKINSNKKNKQKKNSASKKASVVEKRALEFKERLKRIAKDEFDYTFTKKVGELFLEYLELRHKNKLPNTDTVLKRLVRKFIEFGCETEVIERSITGCWKDFYSLEKNNGKQYKSAFDREVEHRERLHNVYVDENGEIAFKDSSDNESLFDFSSAVIDVQSNDMIVNKAKKED